MFIATLVLFIWGGGAINDFAFTFLVGIITGTYSSICVASADRVVVAYKGERPEHRRLAGRAGKFLVSESLILRFLLPVPPVISKGLQVV